MMQIGTITSQGQITIPAKFRRAMKIGNNTRVVLKIDADKIVIEPTSDAKSLRGIAQAYAMKGKSISEVMKIEKSAVRNMYANRSR